jgi:hypothetical protein
MKKGKWMRLSLGLSILLSLLFLQGTLDHNTQCALCFLNAGKDLGYLEIYNNTIYNIQVLFRGEDDLGPFKIKSDPNFMRIDLMNGKYRVVVFVCTPTPDQEPVFYKVYNVDVPSNYGTVSLTVTTPLGYIPVPVPTTPH